MISELNRVFKSAALVRKVRAYGRWLTMRRVPAFQAGPWDFSRHDWLASALLTARGARNDEYGTAAGAIAFASFLALLPLLGAVALIYGIVTPTDRVIADIQTLTFFLPNTAKDFVGDWLVRSITRTEGRESGLLIAIGVALFSAQRAGRTTVSALNTAAGVQTRRGFLRRRMLALTIVFGGAVLVLGALFGMACLAWFERNMPPAMSTTLKGVKAAFWIFVTSGAVAALAILYRYAPNRNPPSWRWILPGALAATLVWLFATYAFSWYLTNIGRTASTYGSVAAIVVLQLWLFLSGYLMLLGAKLNTELLHRATPIPSARGIP